MSASSPTDASTTAQRKCAGAAPLWAVVPAAGRGTRMRGERPKQYLMLSGITILQRSLERLLDVPGLAGLVVVLADNDDAWESLAVSRDERVHVATGGAVRSASVASGLLRIIELAGPDAWVLVHDAARPLVSLADIARLTDAVQNSGSPGGILAVPVSDTIKRADEHCLIDATVERRDLWLAQTPQLFRAGALSKAISAADAATLTDEASAMEREGHQPLLVEALDPNPKITRPVDLMLAEAYLQRGIS